jgi:hypothetical protein
MYLLKIWIPFSLMYNFEGTELSIQSKDKSTKHSQRPNRLSSIEECITSKGRGVRQCIRVRSAQTRPKPQWLVTRYMIIYGAGLGWTRDVHCKKKG